MSEHDNQGSGRLGIVLQGAFAEANPSTGMHQQVSAKIIAKQNDDSYLSEAESERLVAAYIKFKSRYIPDIDYKKPETYSIELIRVMEKEKELKELLAEQAYINGVIASDKYVNVSKSIKFMIYSFCSLVVLLVFEFLVM